jgi:putative molybdopterin biosynthesis protein
MNDISTALQSLARQEQFLDVVDRDEATARFHRHLRLRPLGSETVPLSQALGRVLAGGYRQCRCARVRSCQCRWVRRARGRHRGASERAPQTLALNAGYWHPAASRASPSCRRRG